MKLIIAGTRTLELPWEMIQWFIEQKQIINITEVVSGCCRGVDRAGETFAQENGINVFMCRARWDKWGRKAGPLRNKDMAEYGDALLLIWDGMSNGSANMKETMLSLNKPVYEVILKY